METFKLGNFTVELIDNPAHTLNSSEKERLITDSIPVARKAFRNEDVTESDVIIHAIEVSTGVYIKDSTGKLIAFSGCVPEAIIDKIIIHLKGTALMPKYHKYGLYSILIALRILREAEQHDPNKLLVGTRTQSPVVYHTMSERLGLYPKINEPIPQELKPIAKAYAERAREKHSDFKSKKGLDFDQDSFVVRRVYGGVDENGQEFGFCMYGDKVPWLDNNEEVNDFIRSNLNLSDGDAFLMLNIFSYEKCFDLLSRSVYKINPNEVSIIERFRK